MNEQECLSKMVSPNMIRPSVWRGGVMQIHVTRACDLACHGCTQGSNLAGKPVMITVDEFTRACQSLQGYQGVVGVFGGNPAIHPLFDRLCSVLSQHFPYEQRGIWCNHPRGKGNLMRHVFNPNVSNLNVHLSQDAYDEFKRDWPESMPFGLDKDSSHSPPFVALKDVEPDEGKRWEMISNCDINKYWSAMLCSVPGKGLRAFFCELAGAQAMLHCNDPGWPDTGMMPEPGWWSKGMDAFAHQVRFHCHRCGVPLRRPGMLAINGSHEEVSQTHADMYVPKHRDRPVQLVTLEAPNTNNSIQRSTDYMQVGQATGGVPH